jgi:hypothetical protein
VRGARLTTDGRTRLQHARIFARRSPTKAAELLRDLDATLPPAASMAAAAFSLLSASRTAGITSAGAITLHDVHAYGQTMGTPLSPREAVLVLTMDAAMRDELEKEEAQDKAFKADQAQQARRGADSENDR